MAVNVPMPSLSGDALLKGIDTGSNMFAKVMNAKYNNSLHPSGDVANAMYVEQLRNQYGEDDPRYLQAKAAHEMAMSGHQSLMDYRTQLSNLAPYRAATPEEKLVQAQQGHGVLQTFGPGSGGGGGQKIKAGMVSGDDGHTISEEEAEVYNRALGKKTSDAAIRNKIPYADNVKITMDSIVPEDLVQYSGPEGSLKYGVDTLKAAMGNPPPEFMKYQEALTSAKTLSKQLRQFWGDSIQPSATDKIDQLTNPSHWSKNPQVAMQQFNQLKKITDQELQTFKKAGTAPLKLDYKNGNFLVTDDQKSQKAEQDMGGSKDPSGDFLKAMMPQLKQINPAYTAGNIKHTAQTRGISIEEVVQQLMAKAGVQ
tara:strand:+ start:14979 stop:16079 length:1101 start_codon:yes stop_codon:yes gene_type:complete